MHQEANEVEASAVQQRFWFLCQLAPASPVYNVPHVLRMQGRLDVDALHRALRAIVDRHDSLRTTFESSDGKLLQVVRPALDLPLPLIDLGAADADELESVARITEEEARRPFDLTQGPLVRASLLRLHDRCHHLLLVAHHLIFDAWSLDVLLRDLAFLYDACSGARPAMLPPLPIQYAAFARRQRAQSRDGRLDGDLNYWRECLRGAPGTTTFVSSHPRPARQTFRGATLGVRLPAELAEQLRRLGRAAGCTPFMVLLGALDILLCRSTGQTDLMVGTPVASRPTAETRSLIGLFSNTLVLRTDLSGNPTVREVLRRVRDAARGAFAHQDVPFEMLVDELQPERDLSQTPLFQVVLSVQHASHAPLRFGGLDVDVSELDNGTSKFDVMLSLIDGPDGLTGRLTYNPDLFEEAAVDELLADFRLILEAMVASPDRRVADLPTTDHAGRRKLLAEWNATRRDYPRDRSMVDLFEARVERTPDALAAACGDSVLTYRQLDERANRLAHLLIHLGAGPERRVGVCLGRSLDAVVAMVGVAKSGAAYLPLDSRYPASRVAHMLEDSAAVVLLTQTGAFTGAPPAGCELVVLDEAAGSLASRPAERPRAGLRPDNSAYVVYTSGSTGQPKGVEVSHRSLVNLVTWHIHDFGVVDGDRAALVAGPSFDVAIWEVWPYLSAGASVHVADEAIRADPRRLAGWLIQRSITMCFLPTALAELVLGTDLLRDAPALRAVLAAGEQLHPLVGERVPFQVHNLYGPTETTVIATAGEVEFGSADARPPSIGRPIANTAVYMLDDRLEPVPPGAAGELAIAGDGLARGYLNRPALTAERFVPDPLSGRSGDRMYLSGDLARHLQDGTIEFIGRRDRQVKIRGHRVELGEVETALMRQPEVTAAAVVARRTGSNDVGLVAYVVARDAAPVDEGGLLDVLRRWLPEHMLPSTIVSLDAMPLTPNGKIDHSALVPPAPRESPNGDAAEGTELERAIAEIWRVVLGVSEVGLRDHFFDLGGHSLMMMRVQARLTALLDRPIDLLDLYEFPTIGELAAHLEAGQASEGSGR